MSGAKSPSLCETSRLPKRGGTWAYNSPVTPNRWRIPIGAVLVHVCIGSVYAWSTFNRPIQALFPDAPWWFSPPYTTFTTALALLGLSAAFGGPWVERRGPRVAATAAALFFGTGLVIGGIGLAIRQSVLVFLGMGIIGGIGCGLGYISPVSPLVKWFPDRRGMATGMAIMGFGGGAFVAGYLNVFFMDLFGVAATVMTLGVVYLAVASDGVAATRLEARWLDAAGQDRSDDCRSQRVEE
jgi:MFS family permease